MSKKTLVEALVVVLAFTSVGACTSKPTDTPQAPSAIAGSSGNPSASVEPSHPASADIEISDTPFKKATAGQVVQAWTAKWHAQFRVVQTPLIHIRRAVIDNPFGSGTLQLDVSQKGAGKDPGAVQIGFILRDPMPDGSLKKVTATDITEMIRAFFSPVLSETQIKETSSWINSEHPTNRDETGGGHDFPGLSVHFLNSQGEFSVYLLSR